jgi:hypothetical protein
MMPPSPVGTLADALHREDPRRAMIWCEQDAVRLFNIGILAQATAASRCNGIPRLDPATGKMRATWTSADEERADKCDLRLAKRAADLLARYGVDPATIEAGGDPRGFGLKWRMPSGAHNDLSGLWGV